VAEDAAPSKPAAAAAHGAGAGAVRVEVAAAPDAVHARQRVTVRLEDVSLTLLNPASRPSAAAEPMSPAVQSGGGAFGFNSTPGRILHSLNLTFESGQLIVIMGGSGSGKTSLLSLLAKRGLSSDIARTTGRVLFNGQELQTETWQSVVGYGKCCLASSPLSLPPSPYLLDIESRIDVCID
jgi:ABC-type transport system involved in cytochrome bd biosynthesis fused ATPase/permease subunit